jgi:putative aminopeptidase FrvX
MKKELNFELLKSLYKVFSPSMNEKRMRKFIKRYVSKNIDGVTVVQDKAGNLYLTRGESESYPCICAHMDQVQHLHPKDFECVENDDVIFGYSKKVRKQCGLGADDKNGLFIALECLASYDVMKCAFFVGEEIGCVGSRNADMEFFTDCRFCIQADRRGNGDMVTEIYQQMCSDEFIADADPEKYGYSLTSGAMTDVAELSENGIGVSCINLSCGYYSPHTDNEFSSKSDIQKCYDFVCHIIEDCRKVYKFVGVDKDYGFGWWPRIPKGVNGCNSDYFKSVVRDDINNIVSWDPDATFDEVLDELSYNGLLQYISVEEAHDIYEEISRR